MNYSINNNKDNKELNIGINMLLSAKILFPLNRSLMGPDIRKSFKYFMDIHQEFKPLKFKTAE